MKHILLRLAHIKELPVALLLGTLFVFFTLRAPGFADVTGLLDCIKQYSTYAVLAVGLTIVIASGGIDISVGSIVGLSAVVLGVTLARTAAAPLMACLLAVLAGAAVGVFNGLAIARVKLQPVVVTLSTMAAARGITYVVAGVGVSSINLPDRASWLASITYDSPLPVLLALAVAIGGWLALSKTSFGRALLAIGGAEKAARFSGIDVGAVKLWIYAVCGTLAGIAGVVTAGMMNTATTEAGMGYEFEAITAVLMGGTSILGGEASVVGSVLGVGTAAILNRGLGILGVSDHWRMMCLGLILIASVLLDRLRRRVAR